MSKFYEYILRPVLDNEIYEANVFGKFVSILAWGSTTDLLISIEGEAFSRIKAGMSVKLPDTAKPFYSIRFQNLTGGTVTLEYAVSDGQIIDNRLTVSGTVIASIPGKAAAIGFNALAISNVAPGTSIAANTARRSIFIQNLKANAGDMYIGTADTLTAAIYGRRLSPGDFHSFDDYTGAVYILSTVNNEKVSYIEV